MVHSLGGYIFDSDRFDFIHPGSGLALIGGDISEEDRSLWRELQSGAIPPNQEDGVRAVLNMALAIGLNKALSERRYGVGVEEVYGANAMDAENVEDGYSVDPSGNVRYSSGWEAFGDLDE